MLLETKRGMRFALYEVPDPPGVGSEVPAGLRVSIAIPNGSTGGSISLAEAEILALEILDAAGRLLLSGGPAREIAGVRYRLVASGTPNSREKALVLTKLDEAEMWAARMPKP
jgi:hypothetical protein